jgi:hypothetical protein
LSAVIATQPSPVEPPSAVAVPSPGRDRIGAAVEWALLAIGLVLLLGGQAHGFFGDDLVRLGLLNELLGHGRLSPDPYSLVGPLFAAPLWLADRAAGGPGFWLSNYNLLLFALGLLCAYLMLHRRMDPDLLRRFLVVLVSATMIARYVSVFGAEVFTGLGLGLGVVAVVIRASPAARIAGWTAMVLATVNTPAAIVGLVLVCVAETVTRRRIRYLLPILITAGLIGAEQWLRRGNPLDTGYAGAAPIVKTVMPYTGEQGFSYPFLLGVVAILFSFGKGILWFVPGLVLPVRRRLREQPPAPAGDRAGADLWRIYGYWMLLVTGLVLVYARWWSWYGGTGWGPRFFMVAILPGSLALALAVGDRRARLLGNLATLGVLALSVWVAANSLLFGQLVPPECRTYQPLEMLCHFTPEYSALWYPVIAAPPLGRPQVVAIAYYVVVLAWFGAPVVARTARQIWSWSRETGRPWLAATWRW